MNRIDIITDLGDELIKELYILTDSFCFYYSDECDSTRASHIAFITHTAFINYEYGGKEYDVQVRACWLNNGENTLEVEISGGKGKAGRWKYYDSLEQAVLEYLNENLSMSDLLSSLLVQLRENAYDEWDDHGFRDEADYNNWRYGRSR